MAENRDLYVSDYGAFRVAKSLSDESQIDEGDDGMLWLPDRRLAVVTDGISGEGGNGMDDIERLEQRLEGLKYTRDAVRQAFFAACGEDAHSTIASLWFPETFDQRGLILHAGDSHVLRLREHEDRHELTVLTKEHSVWDSMYDHPEAVIGQVREMLDHVRGPWDLRFISDRRELLVLIACLEMLLEYDREDAFSDDESYSISSLQKVVSQRIDMCRSRFYLCFGDFDNDIRTHIGLGQDVEMRPGDRYVLLTDGVYPDILELEEMLEILLATRESAKQAARQLVYQADIKRDPYGNVIKQDDRTAMVFDVSDRAPKRQRRSPLDRSLGSAVGRYRRRSQGSPSVEVVDLSNFF